MARRRKKASSNPEWMEKSVTLLKHRETHSAVVSSLKRMFSRSPIVQNFLRKHRREEIWYKKDGSKAKKPKVFYRCFHCGKEFSSTQVQVDHIEPVVPLNIPSRHLSYNTLVDRLFCNESNLQILCKKHHAEKSAKENEIRKSWLDKTKYIVYETHNRVNDKKYIGVHKCEDYDDFYLGSGKLLKLAMDKYGKENFYRFILFVYDNAEEAYGKEKELVTPDLCRDEKYYNIATGGAGNEGHHSGFGRRETICHQTGEVFPSIMAAAKHFNLDPGNLSRCVNKPDEPVRGLHFFTTDVYEPSIPVFHPEAGVPIVCLNNKEKYQSIVSASEKLSLNYKSLRNALSVVDENGLRPYKDYFFLYEYEFDPNKTYTITSKVVKCLDTGMIFESAKKAADYVKPGHPNGGIAIAKACREEGSMYGFRWKYELSSTEIGNENCHSIKSNIENKTRRQLTKAKKQAKLPSKEKHECKHSSITTELFTSPSQSISQTSKPRKKKQSKPSSKKKVSKRSSSRTRRT